MGFLRSTESARNDIVPALRVIDEVRDAVKGAVEGAKELALPTSTKFRPCRATATKGTDAGAPVDFARSPETVTTAPAEAVCRLRSAMSLEEKVP